MEKEKQLLMLCRQLIEQSLHWGDSAAWSNDDFDQLSQKIFEKTKVQLSVSTLKRIWGKVRYENFPTTATLNALAGFVDYENWRDFRQKNEMPQAAPAVENPDAAKKTDITKQEVPSPSGFKKFTNRLGLLVIVFIFISSLIFEISRRPVKPVDRPAIKFAAVRISDTLPNSVVFNYDVSAFKSDSVFIQQSWDPARREKVSRLGKQHTSIYYNPGYFLAKLIVDNKIEKECVVSIKTKGWKGIVETSPIPVYLSANEIKGQGFMGISDSLLREKTGSPVFNNTWVKFANVHEYKGIDAANFTFETTLRNSSSVEASVCRQVKVIILGTGSAIIIPLADKGCISDINLLTGDYWISGKDHDLSAFGCDFSKFQDLKLTVGNKRLKVYLNTKLILDTAQKISLGKIEGIRFEFEGAARVKNAKLFTPGAAVYSYKF